MEAWAFDYAGDLTHAFSVDSVEDYDMVESDEQCGSFHSRRFLCHFSSFLLWAQGQDFLLFVAQRVATLFQVARGLHTCTETLLWWHDASSGYIRKDLCANVVLSGDTSTWSYEITDGYIFTVCA